MKPSYPSTKDIINLIKHNNTRRFGLFVFLAFLFLVISKLSSNYKYEIVLQLQLINLDEEVIIKQDSLNVLKAIVEAKGFSLLPYINGNLKNIVLDSKTDIIRHSSHFYFNTINKRYLIEEQLGNSLKLLDVKPDALKINFLTQLSKKVPVFLNANITYAPGYDLKDKITLDSVKLVGLLEDLKKIKHVFTEPISLNNVSSNINLPVNIDVSKAINVKVYPQQVNLKAKVVRFTEGVLKVPIKIINKPQDVSINFFPKQVTISYYLNLESYNSITADDFVVVCDYKKIATDRTYFIPEIQKKPDVVKRVVLKQKRVDFIKL